MNADDIRAALQKRYCAPEWALFFEVANGTGARARRWSDAIAMSLYPSRGLELHGFEIKISKSDYRREAADPEKAESIASYCDRWWVVTPKGLLDTENVPPNWGWIEYDGRAFRVRNQAAKLDVKPLDRTFVAALLRRASEANERLIAAGVAEKSAGMVAEIERRVEAGIKERSRKYTELRKSVDEFEAASGLAINAWCGAEQLGAAVKIVQAVGISNVYAGAGTVAGTLRGYADRIERALADAGMNPVADG